VSSRQKHEFCGSGNEPQGGTHFLGGAERIPLAVDEQGRSAQIRKVRRAQGGWPARRVEGVGQQEQAVHQAGFFRRQDGGLPATVGVPAGKHATGDEGAHGGDGPAQPIAVGGGFGGPGRPVRPCVPEGEIAAENGKPGTGESGRGGHQQRGAAIGTRAMGQHQHVPVAKAVGRAVQEAPYACGIKGAEIRRIRHADMVHLLRRFGRALLQSRNMVLRIDPDIARYRLRIARSAIHRWGVYAEESIPAGRKVIEYTGERISRRETKRRGQGPRTYLFTLDDYWTIDGASGGSGAEIINHSCEPNLRTCILKGHILYISKRAIEPGEELTVDYRFSHNVEKVPCKCGAPGCRGTINLPRPAAPAARRNGKPRPPHSAA
jgi:uncharacterized protein